MAALSELPTSTSTRAPTVERMARRPPLVSVPLIQLSQERHSIPPMPEKLSGFDVQHELWQSWMSTIAEAQRSNVFTACPLVGCMYWCCPLLCFQPCLCMACPTTWMIAINDGRARNTAEDSIRADAARLGNGGLHFRWTMWQTGVFDTSTLYEFRLQTPAFGNVPPPEAVPERLGSAGVTQGMWSRFVALLNAERDAHLLSRCSPFCLMAYHFFPLGGLQPCLCMLNPLTCHEHAKVRRARDEAVRMINGELAPLKLHFKFSQEAAQFIRGPLPRAMSRSGKDKGGFTRVIEVANAAGVPGAARMLEQQAEELEAEQMASSPVRV
jgi:hypothetical protein